MKIKYICENCGYQFCNEKDCQQHEKHCKTRIPIKGIFADSFYIQQKLKINIVEWNEAVLYGDDNIILMPNNPHHCFPTSIQDLRLDRVCQFEDGDEIGIYTTNFSKGYQRECINKILRKIKDKLKISLNEYALSINSKIEQIDNEEYQIERNDQGAIRTI